MCNVQCPGDLKKATLQLVSPNTVLRMFSKDKEERR